MESIGRNNFGVSTRIIRTTKAKSISICEQLEENEAESAPNNEEKTRMCSAQPKSEIRLKRGLVPDKKSGQNNQLKRQQQ